MALYTTEGTINQDEINIFPIAPQDHCLDPTLQDATNYAKGKLHDNNNTYFI